MLLHTSSHCCLHSSALCFSMNPFSSVTFLRSLRFHRFFYCSLIDFLASITCAKRLSTHATLSFVCIPFLSSVVHVSISSISVCPGSFLLCKRKASQSVHLCSILRPPSFFSSVSSMYWSLPRSSPVLRHVTSPTFLTKVRSGVESHWSTWGRFLWAVCGTCLGCTLALLPCALGLYPWPYLRCSPTSGAVH